MIWVHLVICAILIIFFGHRSCVYGHRISEKTGLEASFIGVLFLAIATSLPEVITGAASVLAVNKPNLGFGDCVGSVIINLMILAVIDYSYGKGRLLLKASPSHILTGAFTILLLGILSLSMFIRLLNPRVLSFFNTGLEMPVILILYVWGIRLIGQDSGRREMNGGDGKILAKLWGNFILSLVAITLLGIWLVYIGEGLARFTSLSETFIGALFLGFATSLPELFVTLAAIRIGSVDMAVGNILGSNFFDICIIPVMDVFYKKGPILSYVDFNNFFTINLAILMTAAAIVGISFKKRDARFRVGLDTGAIFALGIAGFFVLYLLG